MEEEDDASTANEERLFRKNGEEFSAKAPKIEKPDDGLAKTRRLSIPKQI